MKKIYLSIALFFIICAKTNGQTPYNKNYYHSQQSARPQWNSYYNGRGNFNYGYSYDARSGWNRLWTPNGVFITYRDGYIPPYYYYNDRLYRSFYPGLGW